ncbi:hypothetical protein [Oceanihabitans sediminis]|uniref:hypothetical protein n=1 Tax=Oceanihabitans sediminis TaxID=1812012 RepID=UPI00093120E6|nr:hypothetical protein [Oceanihabitans sediminis]MDX1277468.1 hypothetical protein [Oceanihabitans sediminis]
MKIILKNISAVILGWVVGSFINMSLVQVGNSVYPIKGIDPNDMQALAEIMPTLDTQHFIFPFLAHALGTLVGAMVAYVIAHNHKMKFALSIGGFFLLGGIAVNYMLTGPAWFTVLDIVAAYLPMAWVGGNLMGRLLKKETK